MQCGKGVSKIESTRIGCIFDLLVFEISFAQLW